MTISNIILRALKKAIKVLEKQNLDYCLFGGLAMQVYKRIRATRDIDLMVAIASGEASKFIAQMGKENFRFDKKRGIIKINNFELMRFIYTDEDTNFEIFMDIITATSKFQKQILARKTKVDFLGIMVSIASLEDLILLKLLADRPIDCLDAQVLLEENKEDIDIDYLNSWAKKFGLLKNLNKALQESA